MTTMRMVALGAIVFLLMAAAAACGGSSDGDSATDQAASTSPAATESGTGDAGVDDAGAADDTPEPDAVDNVETESATDADADQPSDAAAVADAGTLTLGNDVIQLDRARCFLQEQDVSGSAGKILFTAQGFGTTASGEEFVLDVSRYDEDSLFTGDDIQVDVGDPFGDDFYSWNGSAELGTITQAGSTLRADGLTFRHSEDGSELAGAFEIRC